MHTLTSLYRPVILTTLVTAAAAIAAPPDNHWNSPLDFAYTLPGIPDLDQQRAGLAAPIIGPGPTFGVPGSLYCGPTSGMNMVCLMAAKGYPNLLPPGQAGLNWQAAANYGIATGHIDAMADLAYMGCLCEAPPLFNGGTSIGGFVKGLRQVIGARPITVSAYAPTGTFAPNLNQIAAAGLNNNLMSVAYGYYKVIGFTPGGYRIVQRAGGHFVTVAGVQRLGNICKIWVRDPADENPVNILAQTPFVDRMYHVDNGWVFVVGQGPGYWRWMSRISPTAGAPYPGLGGTFQLIDAVVGARPTHALGIKADGKFVLLRPGVGWLGGAGGLAGDGLSCEEIELDFTVVAADTAPDLNGAVVVAQPVAQPDALGDARGDADSDRGPFENIKLVDSATGEILDVGTVAEAQHVAVGRNRSVYVVAAGTELHRLELPLGAEEALPEDAEEPAPSMIELPHAANAVTYDDATDHVVLLSLADGKLMRVAADLSGDVDVQDVPAEIALGTKASLAVDPVGGLLWLAGDASSTIYGLDESADKIVVETIDLPQITAPTSIDFLGDGHMIVAEANGLIEIEPLDAGGWSVVPDSDWAGAECDVPVIVIDEERSNFDPDVHEGPEWLNIDPIELVIGNPEPDPLCTGDLTGDGVIDSADLGVLVGAWGPDLGNPADFNGDGLVDGADLGALLAVWGPCPE